MLIYSVSSHSGFRAEAIAQYVSSTARIPLRFSRPINKARVAMTISTLLLVISAGWRLRSYLAVIVGSSYIWAAGTIVRLSCGRHGDAES